MGEVWIRFTAEENALDSLEKAVYFLAEAKNRPENWKWVIISCHQALYGFAVHVAKGTDDHSVVKTTKSGNQRLISFEESLNRCQTAAGARDALVMSAEEEESIRIFHKVFRNNFEHFNPRLWAIETSGLPEHAKNFISVTRKVAVDINFYTHIHKESRIHMLSIFDKFIGLVMELEAANNDPARPRRTVG